MDERVLYSNAIEITKTIISTCKNVDEVDYIFKLINTLVALGQFESSPQQLKLTRDRNA